MTEIHGTCDPAFASVREAMAENYNHGDVGSSCAVTLDGEVIVDLWAGHRDLARRFPWEQDTLVNVWSTTKMMTAMCVLMLHDRGALDIDSPMATYWPEFAAGAKDGVLVRHVLAHSAGLPAFDDPVDDLTVFDWDECCRRLAGQASRWTPGDGSGYHAETQGWLLGELIRRVDGRTMGNFFRKEVAEPLDLDFHVGLADEHFARVADVATIDAIPTLSPDPEIAKRMHSQRSASLVNTTAWRRHEMPASNGHGNARSIAKAMIPLANNGVANSHQLLSPSTIDRIFEEQSNSVDRVLGRKLRLGIGYGLNSAESPLGVNDRTCWWAGWGGSMCVVDVENNMTVSYAMNRMLGENDLRAIRVIFAAHDAAAQQRAAA